METMTFAEFCLWTENSIKNELPSDYRNARIMIHDVGKLGGSYKGMCVMPEGSNMAPTVDLNLFYDVYRSGMDKESILKKMAEVVQYRHPEMDHEWLSDYSKVREKLFVRLCNAEQNGEVLQAAPHRLFADLALPCHVIMDTHSGSFGSILLTHELTRDHDISEDELFRDALESSSRLMPAELMPLGSLLYELSERSPQAGSEAGGKDTRHDSPFYVLTNPLRINGASALFYPGIMAMLSEELSCSYYILPSSVNELLILPDNGIPDLEWLENMVCDVNRMYVDKKDFLSDNVYYYDSHSKQFGLARELANADAAASKSPAGQRAYEGKNQTSSGEMK